MSRIKNALDALKKDKRKALVIFLTAGDPSMAATGNLVKAAGEAGADIIELGIPFSDPLADGPLIQKSYHRAIGAGATVQGAIKQVELIRKSCDTPIVFMVSSTLVINHGVKKFMTEAAKAGVDGIILPDVPPEEAEEFSPEARAAGLDTIFLAAPTSNAQRLKTIGRLSSGFLYYINVAGVTGGKSASASQVGRQVKSVKRSAKVPVLAGFGVKTPQQARELSRVADGVIIGSRAVDIVSSARNAKTAVDELSSFIKAVRKEMDKG